MRDVPQILLLFDKQLYRGSLFWHQLVTEM